MGSLVIREPAADELPALGALVEAVVGLSPYASVPRYFLSLALARNGNESTALVAEHDRTVVGVVLFGEIAGAVGAGRLHLIAVAPASRRSGIGERLCTAAVAALTSRGARFVIAEVPDEPLLHGGQALLAGCGFGEEARVADYYRDGVAMIVMRREG